MITKRQSEALNFIVNYQRSRRGISPTLDEIAAGIRARHRARVYHLLNQLENRGFIRRLPHKIRAIEVLRATPIAKVKVAYFRFDNELKELVPFRPAKREELRKVEK